MINKEIGQLIRDRREELNMTQLDLANHLGYGSTQFVSLFERGLSKVPLKVLGKVAVVLKMNQKQLKKILIDNESAYIVSEFEQGAKS